MGSGYSKRKKQAKQMQERFMQMQSEMKEKTIEGCAGNGLVTLVINGEGELQSIKIKPECVDPEDVEGLELLIKAAHADATGKLQKNSMSDFPGLGGGMPDLSQFGL